MNKLHYLIVTVVAVVFLSTSAKADHHMSAGFEGGINIASTNVAGSTSQTRFMGGAFMDWMLAEYFYIQPELLYISKGTSLDYIAVPVLLKAKFDAGSGFKPFIVAGPDVSFRISSATGIKTLDFALDFGGGFEVEVSPGVSLLATGRYSLGLTNVIDTAVVPGGDAKTRGIHIMGGVGFAI